ncbi:MAG: ATP-binding protein [Candidatus Woesearchaeota archaeon]
MKKDEAEFCREIERRVRRTIKKYSNLSPDARVIAACSGGKDSTTALYLASKYFKRVTALLVNEGIPHYRDETEESLKKFCNQNGIPLKIISFKREFGITLQEIVKKTNLNACSACGVLRRWLINKYSRGYDCLITGHNLDDEAEAVLMNLFKTNLRELKAQKPYLSELKQEGLTPRLKPLFFISEEQIIKYAKIKGIPAPAKQCPYRKNAFRRSVESEISILKRENPKILKDIITTHIRLINRIKTPKQVIGRCKTCGMPSGERECRACQIISRIGETRCSQTL